ncbi:MAG TPA: hypothetical protein ENK06_00230 [Gammaproteobacteria bacterium]|nr:hypothetical protein [Gammaproteobacteria bacterium]
MKAGRKLPEIMNCKIVFVLFIQLLFVVDIGVVNAQKKVSDDLVFHITDFGINQPWNENMEIGDPFIAESARIYPELNSSGRSGSQILIPMPSDQELKKLRNEVKYMPKSEVDNYIANIFSQKLMHAVNRARENGVTEFEIQIVQNVTKKGYFSSSRQREVQKFSAAAYTAIGRMVDDQKLKGQSVSLDATLGSNGTVAFTENMDSWKRYKSSIRKVDFVDGRAFIDATRDSINELGAKKVRIFNTHGDHLAQSPTTKRIFNSANLPSTKLSIGAAETTELLVKEFPNLTAYVLTPLDVSTRGIGSGHILRMSNIEANFAVERIFNNEGEIRVKQLPYSRSSLDLRLPLKIASTRKSEVIHPTVSQLSPALENVITASRSGIETTTSLVRYRLGEAERWGNLFEGEKRKLKLLSYVNHLYNISLALEADINSAGKNNRHITLGAKTQEALKRAATEIIVDGVLEVSISEGIRKTLPVSVIKDLLHFSRRIGEGKIDVDTVELFLDGFSGIVTYGAVYLSASTAGIEPRVAAKIAAGASEAAKIAVTQVRKNTQSHFNKIMVWRDGAGKKYNDHWYEAQLNNIRLNKEILTYEEYYGQNSTAVKTAGKMLLERNREVYANLSRLQGIKKSQAENIQDYHIRDGISTESDLKIVENMASRAGGKTVIFGDTPGARKRYDSVVRKNGVENVKWIKSLPPSYERRRIAYNFGASVVTTFRHNRYREITTNGYKTRIPIMPGNNMLTPNIQSSQSYNAPRHNQQLQTPKVKNEPVEIYRRRNVVPPPTYYPWFGGPPGPGGGGVSPIQRTSFSSIDRTRDQIFPQTHRVGGVMLNGAAKVSGASNELGAGSFSLLFENGDAGMDVGELRKFVTALWAVYFSQEGPGISIDPIAPNIDKHLVRYIGQVVNSDLGRVMREADYTMKKWAVGTERPQLAGFKNPDDIAGKRGSMGAQAWSRFWFVPEDMRFRKSGDMLLFDGGRMTLKTEYLSRRLRGEADSANEQFAKEFTQSYPLVAQNYPVFQELFDYAKMVSLAKYLKENGIPMLWYLLANKDMILTEDSPGTVNALAKKSDYFESVEITGGVDLATKPSASNYVIDSAAAKALSKAASRYRASSKGSSFSSNNTVVFESGDEAYSLVAPENVVLSGSSVSGEIFQTDIALRNAGVPGLELARYYNPNYKDITTFGKGWHLMIPYKLEPEGTEMIPFVNAMVPKKMVVKNLLSGQKETLTFDKARYNLPGYVPDDAELSSLVGIFWLSNGALRLADKVGSEFQFDPSGRLTDMILTKNYTVSYKYGYKSVEASEFRRSPYRIKPMGRERVSTLNVTLPKRMQLVNERGQVIDTFVFDQDNKHEIIGYSPVAAKDSNYEFMALLSDGSFQLAASKGQMIAFDAAGRFEVLKEPVVKKMVKGKHEIRFAYEYDGENGFRISSAKVMTKGGDIPLYASSYLYGHDGRLASVKQPSGNKVKIDYGHNTIKVASL